jgi:hypothetical protein
MSNYPNGFDNNTTIPPAYSDDVVFSVKYSCQVDAKSFSVLRDPATGGPLILTPNKNTSLRISCAIVQEDDSMIMGQIVNYAGVYCTLVGEVYINFNRNQFEYNPGGLYSISLETSMNSALKIIVNNNSLRRVKASAVIEFITL